MRPIIILAIAAILTPAALSAQTASAPGLQVTDVSAAKKKAKKPAKPKDEYLKAAPGAGPSGPATKY
jgi:hypothetical protein